MKQFYSRFPLGYCQVIRSLCQNLFIHWESQQVSSLVNIGD